MMGQMKEASTASGWFNLNHPSEKYVPQIEIISPKVKNEKYFKTTTSDPN